MKKLESSLKNMTIVLTSVSIIAAALLGYMNELTKEPIAVIEKQNLENGIKKVIIGKNLNQDVNVTIEEKEGFTFYKVTSANGELIGTAVKTAVTGFSPDLTVLAGFDPQGNILGYEVLKHSETPGLGAKVNLWFQEGNKGNIIGKNPGKCNLAVKKDGGEIDAITASTITSRAFLKAINLEYNKLFNITNGNTGATNANSNVKETRNAIVSDSTSIVVDTLNTDVK